MRRCVYALLAAAAAAELVQVHGPAVLPRGWEAVDAKVPADMVFSVTVGLKRSNTDRLGKLLDEVSDPRSAAYLQYPSYDEIGALVRPSAEHTERVMAWLRTGGAVVQSVHPHGDYIKAKVSAANLEAMAHGTFQAYAHPEAGIIHRITSGVHVPADVAAAIDTFSGFQGFPLVQKPKKRTVGAAGAVTPAVFRKTYNMSSVSPPTGSKKNIQAIAQFQGQYVNPSQLDQFCEKYNDNTQCVISKYIGRNLPIAGVESMLDSEYIMSIGNLTETWVFSYPNTDFCSDLTTFGSDVIAESEHPLTVSISYGSQKIDFCDSSITTRFSEDIQKMGTMGITVMISSGDDGSGGESRQGSNGGKLSPSFPASIPYCVAVGGTYFVTGTSGEEEATTQFGSGGGFSYDYSVPSYQASAVSEYLSTVTLPKLQYATGRGSPDVSALAEDFTVYTNGGTEAVGGTSASSPSFTGIMTLLNNACMAASGKTLGFVNPLFYQNPKMFTDVTRGTNAIGENREAGWAAIKGWDAATGLGTPNFPAMLAVVRSNCAAAAARKH